MRTPSGRRNGSFLPPERDIDRVNGRKIIEQSRDLEHPAAVLKRRAGGGRRADRNSREIADDRPEAVAKTGEHIKQIQKHSVLEVESRVVMAATNERDDEHRPYNTHDDDATLEPALGHVPDTRQKPRNESDNDRIFHQNMS